jgi:hypothetical protein
MRLISIQDLCGPGDAQRLRDLIWDASNSCYSVDCPHGATIMHMLAELDAPRLVAAGPGYIACARHGVQPASHECDSGYVTRIEDAN